MKIVFIITRLNTSKWYAPLIKEALDRSLDVECWLDHQDVTTSTRWYEFPSEEKLPKYPGPNQPKIFIYKTNEELKALAYSNPEKVVFTLHLLKFEKPQGQVWIHLISSFFDSLFWMKPKDLNRFDYIICNTEYWVKNCFRYYEIRGDIEKNDSLYQEVQRKFIPLGSPQYDHFKLCKREDKESKAITLFAFEGMASYWFQRIFLVPTFWRRLFYLITMPFSYPYIYSRVGLKKLLQMTLRSLKDRFLYLKEILTSKSEGDVLLATKEFSQNNHAKLIFKYRKRNPQKKHQKKIADFEIFEDTEYYPYTSAKTITNSDLIITFNSSAAAEGVFAGIPVINLITHRSKFFVEEQYDLLFPWPAGKYGLAEEEIFYSAKPGEIFNYPGVVWAMTVNEFVKKMPTLSLLDFKVDPKAREAYIKKFLAPEADGQSSKRVMDFIIQKFSGMSSSL